MFDKQSQYENKLKGCPYFIPNDYVDTPEQARLYMSVDTGHPDGTRELVVRDRVPPVIDQNVLCAFYTAKHDVAKNCMQIIFDAINQRGDWPIEDAFKSHARERFFCSKNLGSTGFHVFQYVTHDAPMTNDEEQVLLNRLFHYGHYSESAINLLQHIFESKPITEKRIRHFLDNSALYVRHDHFERYIQIGVDLSLLSPELREKIQAPFESGLINESQGKVCDHDSYLVQTYRQRAKKLVSLLHDWEEKVIRR